MQLFDTVDNMLAQGKQCDRHLGLHAKPTAALALDGRTKQPKELAGQSRRVIKEVLDKRPRLLEQG